MAYTQGNKALGERQSEGRELHVFQSDGGGVVTYFGQYVYREDFEQTLSDRYGSDRTAIQFRLQSVDENPSGESIEKLVGAGDEQTPSRVTVTRQ